MYSSPFIIHLTEWYRLNSAWQLWLIISSQAFHNPPRIGCVRFNPDNGFQWRRLGWWIRERVSALSRLTLRASMTRSRASSSPSMILSRVSSSGLLRLSMLNSHFCKGETKRGQRGQNHQQFIVKAALKRRHHNTRFLKLDGLYMFFCPAL